MYAVLCGMENNRLRAEYWENNRLATIKYLH